MSELAFVTPVVLKWARESARMSEETAAKKADVSVEKLRAWENGKDQPTIKKAQALAKAYRRPFAVFFLPEVPRDFQPLQDFRKKNSKQLTTSSIFIIREIQQKQAWISELLEQSGEKRIELVGRFSTKNDPIEVADDIINTLGVYSGSYKSDNPIKEWIAAAEKKGIFVSRTSFIHSKLTLDSEEFQGFAIADPYAPFVFVNSDDWNAAQLFTLIHEIAHIWLAQSGISNSVDEQFITSNEFPAVEEFCNEVAANVLLPRRVMEGLSGSTFANSTNAYKAAKRLGISSFTLLLRALKLRRISDGEYIRLKKQADIDYAEFISKQSLKDKSEGGPNYYLLKLNRNGRLFTQTVLDAYRGGSIQPSVASELLDIKINQFQKLEVQVYK